MLRTTFCRHICKRLPRWKKVKTNHHPTSVDRSLYNWEIMFRTTFCRHIYKRVVNGSKTMKIDINQWYKHHQNWQNLVFLMTYVSLVLSWYLQESTWYQQNILFVIPRDSCVDLVYKYKLKTYILKICYKRLVNRQTNIHKYEFSFLKICVFTHQIDGFRLLFTCFLINRPYCAKSRR